MKAIRSILFGLGFTALFATGYIYFLFAWCDEHIGGWFAPFIISLFALIVILIPICQGIKLGIDEVP